MKPVPYEKLMERGEPDYQVTMQGRYWQCDTCMCPFEEPSDQVTITRSPIGVVWLTPHRDNCSWWANQSVPRP